MFIPFSFLFIPVSFFVILCHSFPFFFIPFHSFFIPFSFLFFPFHSFSFPFIPLSFLCHSFFTGAGVGGTGARGRRGTSSALDGTIKIDMKDPITGGGSATATHEKNGGTSSCSRIFEGPQVNIDVTSAGATVALGLMYLKTNNVAVAARLAVPHTLFLLDYVRPDLLMVRQL